MIGTQDFRDEDNANFFAFLADIATDVMAGRSGPIYWSATDEDVEPYVPAGLDLGAC
jgi:hypothetical protein